MNDILKTYMERFRENRHTLRRYTAFVLALAMITTLFVNWQLHGVGISMTAQYQCGEVEHAHTADCYTRVLTCGYEEGELENADEVAAAATSQPSAEEEPAPLALEPQIEFVPHEHTADCYTEVQTLTCKEEEHVHGDDCFDPEDGSLICDKFEHTHDESCYTTEYELTCGLEEGQLVEQVVEPTQSAELAAMAVAEPVALEPVVDTVEPIYHHHTDACYEEVLTCPLPEHHHTVACLSDITATEDPAEWQASNADAVITGDWNEDLLSVAKTQLGYEQSEKNFEIDPADGVTLRYYTRYGASYNNPYGVWDVMFLTYCLKYAGIPDSAIPQEASVLALRSSMSGMDWLLDGEDGSAADVGDIVIYNKYITRTVAVDSSADGTDSDLDDLFSTDAALENSAELEDSGASALDFTPSTGAEDTVVTSSSGTQDTVLTAPGTVDPEPEQPAEKPVYSAGTAASSTAPSVSGADTLIPSVVSPAAEPQTTTVTDASPVETVGIVSEVDSNAGTLTVISGDVDGKVAEVPLSFAEILGVIDVAAAQYANTYGGQLPTISSSRPNRAPALTAGGKAASLSDDWISKITATVDGTSHTVKDKNDSTAFPNLTVKDGGSVELTYHFTIPQESGLPTDTTTLTYQLPDGFKLDTAIIDAELQDDHSNPIGTITVETDGKVTLTFDNNLDRKQTTGHFFVNCKVDKSTATYNEEIHFPGTGTTIEIKKENDLTLGKSGTLKGRTDDGKYIMHYTVTASSVNGSGKPIVLRDYMKLKENSSFADNATYQNITVTKKTSTGSIDELIKGTDFKVTTDTSVDLTDKGIADGNPGILITTPDDQGLPELGEGESYILEYDVVVDHVGPGGANLENCAIANDKTQGHSYYFQDELNKIGRYDPKTGKITWTITIIPNGVSMDGYVLKDTLPTGCKMTGEFKIEENGTAIVDESDFAKDEGSFSYTFSGTKYQTPAFSYTVTYKTTAPADFSIGTTVTNHAELQLNGSKKWDASGDATYNDRRSSTEKNALNDTKLTESQATNKIFTLPWSLKVTPPIVWSSNRLEIADTIKDPWSSSGTISTSAHYSILKDLHEDIKKNLVLTLEGGATITYDQLAEKGLSLQIIYYAYPYCNTELATVDLNGSLPADKLDAHVKSFKLVFQKNGYTGAQIDAVEITKYNTLGDYKGLGEGQTIYFENESNGASAKYEYTIPGNSTKELIKMSSGTKPGRNEAGDFKTGSTTVYSGNGADGETYIYYQLKLVTHNTAVNFPITITDVLPDYVSYVPGSAYLIAAHGNDSGIWNHYTSAQLNFPEGADYNYNLSKPDLFECTLDDATNTLTFQLKDRLKYLIYPSAADINAFYIRYAVKVDNSIWASSLDTQYKVFSNSAMWEGVGGSKTDTTVEYKTALLKKSAEYYLSGNKVNYSIIINPDKMKLGDAEMIKLTDTMVITGKPTDSAALVESTVKLYSYNAATGQKGTELPSDSYRVDYTEVPYTGGNQHTYILTVEVPNGFAYVLEYQYANTSNTAYTMENEAKLSSYVTKTVTTQVQHTGAGGSAHTDGMTIHKVDSQNSVKSLPGAEFTLYWFDPSDGEYKEVQTEVTDAYGDINLTFSEASGSTPGNTNSSGKTIRPYNYLYKLVETKAPDGYALDSTPHYFIWTKDSPSTAYSSAVGENASKIGVDPSKINYYYHNESITLRVKNTSNRLTIQKLWYDKDGNAIDEATKLPDYITVELYKRTDTTSVGDYVGTYQLTAANGWKFSYDVPAEDLECYFYVKETSTGANYDVIYTNNNVKGTGTILVTNKEKENADYELPSTGGTGTIPFTAVGGTMMLSALAYSFIHHKHRREGRTDD